MGSSELMIFLSLVKEKNNNNTVQYFCLWFAGPNLYLINIIPLTVRHFSLFTVGIKHQIYWSECLQISSSEAQLGLNKSHHETSRQTSPLEENNDSVTRKYAAVWSMGR